MFIITLQQVSKLFLFLILGFFLNSAKLLPDQTQTVLSRLLYYCFLPCLLFSTFSARFTVQTFRLYLPLLGLSICLMAVNLLYGTLSARLITKDPYDQGICRYSIIVPNTGYVGTALVLSLFGKETLMLMHIFCIPLAFYTYSEGVRTLLGKQKFQLRAFLNPILIAIFVGMIFGLLSLQLPEILAVAIDDCSACLAPVSMILTGFTIGEYRLGHILRDRRIYAVVALRMIVAPLLLLAVGRFLQLSAEQMLYIGAVYTMPTGLNTVVIPSSIGKDPSLGAGLACVSDLLALVTIPLFFSLFIA